MRNVIFLRDAVAARVCYRAIAEPALEPSPADALVVEQIADIPSGQGGCLARRALVKCRLGIANHRTARQIAAGVSADAGGAVGLPGNQVQRARRGGSKCR